MPSTDRPVRATLRVLLHGSAGIAVAMAVMNVSTYGFQVAAARILGPAEYGGLAGLMAVYLVVGVVQLGLQATGARRIASSPGHVAEIERVVLAVTYRAALVVGAVMLAASPLVWVGLRLDSPVPAVLLALGAVPMTICGGQAGILQGERRWLPLSALYLAIGVPRLLLGTTLILLRPTEAAAMLGVALAMWVPVVVGWVSLRRPRDHGGSSQQNALRAVLAETLHGSVALLAFFVLSNVDIIVARNVLDDHEAGLYAGGLILTKAVLFLPQFVVVVAFPSMSAAADRRRTFLASLGAVVVLGACCTLGAWALPGVAMAFVGGSEYADVESRLWLFAVLGTLLAGLQLLVYAVLARQSRRAAYLVWLVVGVLVATAPGLSTLDGLLAAVTVLDTGLLAVLLGLTLWRMRTGAGGTRPAAEQQQQQPG